ncbi:DUF4369 domain-containing protein [Pedobacter sp. UC225_65]|uniref:DUF4369 domain-containing protein n=1 Tax=Pedobacter sp. UC225_65 TaxID=3350173 RepID=UPI00366A9F5E
MKNFQKPWKVALLCAILLHSMSTFAQQKIAQFTIHGQLNGAKDGTIVKLHDIDKAKTIDSAQVINGKFVLTGHVDEPTTCWLRCGEEYTTIQVENVRMNFSSPLKDMKLNSITSGGKEQSLQTELDRLLRPYEKVYTPLYDSLNKKLYQDTTQRKQMVKTFNAAIDAYQNVYVAFGKRNINSYLGLDIVYRNRKAIPKDSVLLLFNSLTHQLKATDKAKALSIYAKEILAKKGHKYLDFSAVGINGEPFQLSTLKDKYIYLAFGSFGCVPCRIENREISKNYELLSKSLHIVNFSLDVNRKEWELAAKQDGIKWYNVSDMAGMAGKIKTLYDVQAMPTSFLIDKNGIIVERFDGYSEENLNRIKKIIGLN